MRALALRSSGTARPGPNTFSRRWHLMAAPVADAADTCWAREPSRAPATAIQPRPGTATGREACFGQILRRRCLPGCVGTRHRWRTWRPADGRRCAATARLGLALSWAATAATMSSRRRGSMGIARVSLAAPRPRDVRRGHEHPRGKNQVLRNGPELGEALDCPGSEFPRPSAGCFRPALVAGLGISRVLGSGGSSRHTANRRGSRSACTTESRRWKRGNRAWPDLGAIRQKLPPTRDLRLRGRSVQPAQTTDREGSHEPATPTELLSYKTVTDCCRHRDHQKRRGR